MGDFCYIEIYEKLIEMFGKECQDVNRIIAEDNDILTEVNDLKQRFS